MNVSVMVSLVPFCCKAISECDTPSSHGLASPLFMAKPPRVMVFFLPFCCEADSQSVMPPQVMVSLLPFLGEKGRG